MWQGFRDGSQLSLRSLRLPLTASTTPGFWSKLHKTERLLLIGRMDAGKEERKGEGNVQQGESEWR